MPALSRRTTAATESKARSEAAFLEATTALLAEGTPYGELGVETIAQRAGFSRATFYAYFSDKRDLLMRLADTASQDLFAEAGRRLGETGTDDLREMLTIALEVMVTHRTVLGAMAESATYDAEVAKLWRDLHNRFIEIGTARLRSERPDLPEDEARARAFALVWMTARSFLEHVAAPQVQDDSLISALELLWRTGILKQPERSPDR
jgi:AcrR family transcriptional regulator